MHTYTPLSNKIRWSTSAVDLVDSKLQFFKSDTLSTFPTLLLHASTLCNNIKNSSGTYIATQIPLTFHVVENGARGSCFIRPSKY